jgi:hypothetical protein
MLDLAKMLELEDRADVGFVRVLAVAVVPEVDFLSLGVTSSASRLEGTWVFRKFSSCDSSESVEGRWRMTRRGCWSLRFETLSVRSDEKVTQAALRKGEMRMARQNCVVPH